MDRETKEHLLRWWEPLLSLIHREAEETEICHRPAEVIFITLSSFLSSSLAYFLYLISPLYLPSLSILLHSHLRLYAALFVLPSLLLSFHSLLSFLSVPLFPFMPVFLFICIIYSFTPFISSYIILSIKFFHNFLYHPISPIPFVFCLIAFFLLPSFSLSTARCKERELSLSSALLKTEISAPGGTQITNSDIFIICTIETLVHYSKHFLYTEKMVRPKAQNGSSIIAAQHFFNFIHILFFVKTVS